MYSFYIFWINGVCMMQQYENSKYQTATQSNKSNKAPFSPSMRNLTFGQSFDENEEGEEEEGGEVLVIPEDDEPDREDLSVHTYIETCTYIYFCITDYYYYYYYYYYYLTFMYVYRLYPTSLRVERVGLLRPITDLYLMTMMMIMTVMGSMMS